MRPRGARRPMHRRYAAIAFVSVLALTASACGSRLTSAQQAEAIGSSVGHTSSGPGTSGTGGASGTTTTTLANASGVTATTAAGTSGGSGTDQSGTNPVTGAASSGASGTSGSPASANAASAPCGADGNQMPAAGNGGATATGVTASTITVGNIASITGVVPGLTQSAQQATEAWAAYVNSQGGICGRQIKVQPFDDSSQSGENYSDTQQACSSDFAMVGNASGFDDGSASAAGTCGIPIMAAEVSTQQAGASPYIYGASPGDGHHYELGPAEYLKSQYPNAIKHAAMIYLEVPATQYNAMREVQAYTSVGFDYVYDESALPTQPNYAANVQAMQGDGVQYVTEYSDEASAVRLLESMQQYNFTPQVVDWFSEEYSPQFLQQTTPASNGDLVLMSATSAYTDAPANPELQLFLQWMNRVAPGFHQDIFAILAWSAGLAFEQAAKEVGPDLTRPALLNALKGITTWTGDGIQPPVNISGKVPSQCFAYLKIENGQFVRIYPTQINTYDCSTGLYNY
ncbi:MAG TPA: ABC transporter substrate-binding protein [Acidimicrobiales bacterium]|nr:ABC transporter substrate-binding protein [Acidimicrobiales bacterium]